MKKKETYCLFCNRDKLQILDEEGQIFAIKDQFPVTEGHHLVIPKMHRKDFFELSQDEQRESFALIEKLKTDLMNQDPTITGFNIGMNCGEDAGQTIYHCHIHLIPRRKGDCHSPKGGVRGVIPEKQSYSAN